MDLVKTLPSAGHVLVVVAHPDDEVIGCFGLICRLVESGHPVSVRIVHNGNQDRYRVSSALANEYGYHCKSAPDEIFSSDLAESRRLIKTIDDWLDEIRPVLIVTHGVYQGDHHEHRLVGNAVTTSWLRYRSRLAVSGSSRLIRILPFPIGLGFVPTTFTDTRSVLARKAQALDGMNKVLERSYLMPSLHDELARDLGERYFAKPDTPVEVFEEELRESFSPSTRQTSPAERHASALMVTTPLPVARVGASPDALKLVAEEYRVCSARADELQRLVWQVFVVIGAITSVLGAAMVRAVGTDNAQQPFGTLLILLICVMGIYFLSQWTRIASKWSAQMRLFYQRIDSLEQHLHFRTNSQTSRLDESRSGRFNIGDLRDRLASVLALWWALLGGFAVHAATTDLGKWILAMAGQPRDWVASSLQWTLAAATVSALFYLYLRTARTPYK